MRVGAGFVAHHESKWGLLSYRVCSRVVSKFHHREEIRPVFRFIVCES